MTMLRSVIAAVKGLHKRPRLRLIVIMVLGSLLGALCPYLPHPLQALCEGLTQLFRLG